MFKHLRNITISLFLTIVAVSASAQGYEPDSLELQIGIISSGRSVVGLPPLISLRKDCPIPQDQGAAKTCVSWAVAYAALSIQKRKGKNPYSAIFLAHFTHRFNNFDKSVSIGAALKQLKKGGTVVDAGRSRMLTNLPSTADSVLGLDSRINDFKRIPKTNFFIQHIKAQLKEGRPVILGIEVDETFENYSKGVWIGCVGKRFKHAVCIIGYDDNNKHAFEIMNSWGNNWGESGFGWMHYNAVEKHHLIAFVIE